MKLLFWSCYWETIPQAIIWVPNIYQDPKQQYFRLVFTQIEVMFIKTKLDLYKPTISSKDSLTQNIILQASILCSYKRIISYCELCRDVRSKVHFWLSIPRLGHAVALDELAESVSLELWSQFHHLIIHSLPSID